jgi:molecular chaperone GrpE (heat shock protein)
LAESASSSGHSLKDRGKIATLYCDEGSMEPRAPSNVKKASSEPGAAPLDELAHNIRKAILSDYRQNTLKLQDSLRSQTENLQRQINEFTHMTQSVREAALEHSKPLNGTIKELTQQVSAIREYASHQQDKIHKLQDGYDWKIVRAFCLRIIRCIDNLEKRINDLAEENVDTANLEETRDELLFALESGAVEQFKPEINSEYCGQQKLAEVIKDKQHTEDPDMKGKIALVIRPGYRYVVDENNVKVVRPAQVKLYG